MEMTDLKKDIPRLFKSPRVLAEHLLLHLDRALVGYLSRSQAAAAAVSR